MVSWCHTKHLEFLAFPPPSTIEISRGGRGYWSRSDVTKGLELKKTFPTPVHDCSQVRTLDPESKWCYPIQSASPGWTVVISSCTLLTRGCHVSRQQSAVRHDCMTFNNCCTMPGLVYRSRRACARRGFTQLHCCLTGFLRQERYI
jgi:hypothetical protein